MERSCLGSTITRLPKLPWASLRFRHFLTNLGELFTNLASYNPRGVMIGFSEEGQVKHWIMELQLSYTIANRVEWSWSQSDSLNICFCGTWRCTTYNSVPIILILLNNKNVALINSVTICEQRTKDCAPSGSFQHKVKHCCFYLRCLPPFIKSPLYYGFRKRI